MSTFNGGPQSIVTNGLVLYLDAANRESYVSGSTTWNDLSIGRNNGTLTNGPTFDNGNGGSIVLDGGNDYVEIGNTINTEFDRNFSVECVFNQLANSNPGSLVEKYNWAVAGKGGWVLRFVAGTLIFGIVENTNFTSVSVSSTLSINTTYHITAVCNGGPTTPTIQVYVNGILNNSGTLTTNIGTTIGKSILLGTRGDGTGTYNNTRIHSVKIYNRALSSTEVSQNFNATRTRFGV